MSIVLVVLIGVLFATGTYSMMHRSLTRIIVGVGLIGNGVNLLLIVAGSRPGVPPIVGKLTGSTDPIPQALVLTAIVIGFALQAFLLALAWRSWTLNGHDDVEDDIEDMLLAAERRRNIRQDEAAGRVERERLLGGDDGPLLSGPATDHRRAGAMMGRLAPLPTVIPLLAAAIALLFAVAVAVQRAISVSAIAAALGMSVALLVEADRSGPLVARIGAWSPTIGISYRIDRFAGLMLVIAMITLLTVLLFAIGEHSRKSSSPIFHPCTSCWPPASVRPSRPVTSSTCSSRSRSC